MYDFFVCCGEGGGLRYTAQGMFFGTRPSYLILLVVSLPVTILESAKLYAFILSRDLVCYVALIVTVG